MSGHMLQVKHHFLSHTHTPAGRLGGQFGARAADRLRQRVTHQRQPRSAFQQNNQRVMATHSCLLSHGKKRGMFTSGQQSIRQHTSQGGWAKWGGHKMFTAEAQYWILILHSAFTRCTSLPQRWPNTLGNGAPLLQMTCCQTWRTDTPSSP